MASRKRLSKAGREAAAHQRQLARRRALYAARKSKERAERAEREKQTEKRLAAARKRDEERAARRVAYRERRERIEAVRADIEPLLASMVKLYDPQLFWSENKRRHPKLVTIHANWYEKKIVAQQVLGWDDYYAMLEAMSYDYDLEEIDWDIVY